jgi:hypothetical protein
VEQLRELFAFLHINELATVSLHTTRVSRLVGERHQLADKVSFTGITHGAESHRYADWHIWFVQNAMLVLHRKELKKMYGLFRVETQSPSILEVPTMDEHGQILMLRLDYHCAEHSELKDRVVLTATKADDFSLNLHVAIRRRRLVRLLGTMLKASKRWKPF